MTEDGEEKCIFEAYGKPEIVQGNVVVTRAPCHLPTDIQCFRAVDNLAVRDNFLDDNFNVIVFSSQGERPSFNKMSNGDLDGDTYFACWDPELVKHFNPDEIRD